MVVGLFVCLFFWGVYFWVLRSRNDVGRERRGEPSAGADRPVAAAPGRGPSAQSRTPARQQRETQVARERPPAPDRGTPGPSLASGYPTYSLA